MIFIDRDRRDGAGQPIRPDQDWFEAAAEARETALHEAGAHKSGKVDGSELELAPAGDITDSKRFMPIVRGEACAGDRPTNWDQRIGVAVKGSYTGTPKPRKWSTFLVATPRS